MDGAVSLHGRALLTYALTVITHSQPSLAMLKALARMGNAEATATLAFRRAQVQVLTSDWEN